jgi:hypothetical protein
MNLPGEVIFEFAHQGPAVRVTAFHVDSMTEIVMQAPAQLSQWQMEQAAMRKLAYVLNKRRASPLARSNAEHARIR